MRLLWSVALSICCSAPATASLVTGKMYWPNRNTIQRANLDGSGFETLIPIGGGVSSASGIDIDVQHGHMYIADGDRIMRANLDGTGLTTILWPAVTAYTVRLDVEHQWIYWSDRGNVMRRVNFDGTGNTIVFHPGVGVWGMDLDLVHNKVYWGTGYSHKIYRANLDGTDKELLVTSAHDTSRIRLDVADGKMYWSNDNAIQRSNLDGTNVETLVTGFYNAIGIALDFSDHKMYWTDNLLYHIGRANFDGTQKEILLHIPEPPAAPNPLDIAIIPVPEPSTASLIIFLYVIAAHRRSGGHYRHIRQPR